MTQHGETFVLGNVSWNGRIAVLSPLHAWCRCLFDLLPDLQERLLLKDFSCVTPMSLMSLFLLATEETNRKSDDSHDCLTGLFYAMR